MYKVTVNTPGKYGVVLGARYCLTRKSAIKVANLFLEENCDITVTKFIRCGDAFVWSDAWEETRIAIYERVDGTFIARKVNRYGV